MYFYNYDCNGSMLTRVENGVSYTQGWDQENRLQTVTVNGATTTFTYDGDGKLVKKTVSGSGGYTTYYVGPHYEKNATTNVVTKYYFFGSQRVAMRVCTGTNGSCGPNGATSTLTYLHGDHLGSASLSTNATGGKVSEMRYYPYGETCSGSMTTDRQFTGQRNDYYIKLYAMGTRMYDPELGRFISPDSIVPDFSNPQSLNRYAYVVNNPLKYRDPTGHWFETALDIAGIAWDIYDIHKNGLNWTTGLALTVDVVCLIVPVATGGGAAIRALSKADDVADTVRAINRVDNIADTVRAVDVASDAAKGLDFFASAKKFGIDTYSALRGAVRKAGETGVEVHHIIEKRLAKLLGTKSDNLLSVVLTKSEHLEFTNAWRKWLPYGTDYSKLSLDDIWEIAQKVYKDNPDLLDAARKTIFGE